MLPTDMSISAAHTLMPFEFKNAKHTALSGTFSVAVTNGKKTQFSANTNATINNAASGTDTHGLLAPTSISWEQQVLNKLEAGLEGEAFNLLMTKLDGREESYVISKLSSFMEEFSDRGFKDLAVDVGNILQMLSYDSLGLDYDFMASGPNAANAVEEMKKHMRHPIERHFDQQIYNPPQFVQPFLGHPFG